MNALFRFAAEAHKGQGYSGRSYGYHLAMTRMFLKKFGLGTEVMLQAATGHDLIEDTELTEKDLLAAGFLPEAIELIKLVTDAPGATRKERKAGTYLKLRGNTAATAVKLADRIANVTFTKRLGGTGHLKMYRREFPAFVEGLKIEGELTEMWEYLATILA